MSISTAHNAISRCDTKRPYHDCSLLDLITLIARSGDRTALDELHTYRTPFRYHGGQAMRLVEFVETLGQGHLVSQFAGCCSTVKETACDLTIDQFAYLCADDDNTPTADRNVRDCRRQFQKVIDHMCRWAQTNLHADPLRQETAAATSLQRQIVRQFFFACLEAKRQTQTARSRYAWHLEQGVIYVWMPVWLSGHRRRKWLEDHIRNPDPTRSNEKQRVQAIIDQQFGNSQVISLGAGACEFATSSSSHVSWDWLVEHEIIVHGLAKVIADEKAHRIDQQRPAIRALGKSALRRLILRIFEDLTGQCYQDKAVAKAFGLTKATLSRFAGSHWKGRSDRRIPDLFANTAQTLSNHHSFTEAARDAGVWLQVELALSTIEQETQL